MRRERCLIWRKEERLDVDTVRTGAEEQARWKVGLGIVVVLVNIVVLDTIDILDSIDAIDNIDIIDAIDNIDIIDAIEIRESSEIVW